MRGPERLGALDGLRGLAALVVLLSHVVQASTTAMATGLVWGSDPPGALRWLLRSPAAVVWAGTEFVIVFFVLSGFVLTRGALRAGGLPVLPYYASRLVRLYLPVWAALIPAAALLLLVPRHAGAAPDLYLGTFAVPVGPQEVGADLALVVPSYGTGLNVVLWSLRWEVLFSIGLPLLLLAAGQLRRHSALVVAVVLVLVLDPLGHVSLMYLPPFVLGVVAALHEQRLAALRGRLAGRGAALLLATVCCLLTADLWLPGALHAQGPGGALVVAGAGLTVLGPLLYASWSRPLQRRPMQWLGRRSFSLYLVHEPIVITLAFGLGHPSFAVLLPIALPLSLLAAATFHRVVERPSQRLARAASAQAQRRVAGGRPAPSAAVG